MKRRILFSAIRVFGIVGLVTAMLGCFASQPSLRRNQASQVSVDAERLRAHVVMLSETFHPRSWRHVENLDRCAEYIAAEFERAGASVEFQAVEAAGQVYRNVVGRFGAGLGSRIVVGAHYDTYGDTPGADDNASGVAALIELAHLFGRHAPEREIDLVAYVLEEPPFFRSPLMGSAVHAEALAEEGVEVAGVVVLEMVGYFSDEPGSQSYPSLLLRLVYPSRGNFIAVVGRMDQGRWIKGIKTGMKGATDLPVYSIRAPRIVPGVDLSDHRNYWLHGFNAVMVTDTAFYRNRAYHTPEDTADRLDYGRMAKVAIGVFEAVRGDGSRDPGGVR